MPITYDNSSLDEVELRVFGGGKGSYTIQIRSAAGEARSRQRPLNLRSLPTSDPQAYGGELFRWLFQGTVAETFQNARSLASSPYRTLTSELELRFRLWLDPDAPELETFNWESLWDPIRKEPLSLRFAFSRYLRVEAPQSRPSPVGQRRMLLVIAIPQYQVAPLPDIVEKTVTSIKSRLWEERVKVQRLGDQATLAQMQASAADGCDLIHLWGRSVQEGGQQHLLLMDEGGQVTPVPAETVAAALLGQVAVSPSLVFISVPLEGESTAVTKAGHLGPVMIGSGAQTVVSIENQMRPEALRRFTETFYNEVMRNDIADLAVARARADIFDATQWDWTAPVLYTRSQDVIGVVQQVSSAVEGTVVGVDLGTFRGGSKTISSVGGSDVKP